MVCGNLIGCGGFVLKCHWLIELRSLDVVMYDMFSLRWCLIFLILSAVTCNLLWKAKSLCLLKGADLLGVCPDIQLCFSRDEVNALLSNPEALQITGKHPHKLQLILKANYIFTSYNWKAINRPAQKITWVFPSMLTDDICWPILFSDR